MPVSIKLGFSKWAGNSIILCIDLLSAAHMCQLWWPHRCHLGTQGAPWNLTSQAMASTGQAWGPESGD